MTLLHPQVRLFRLSCDCLRAYPMMPVAVSHAVLCIRCRAEVQTVLAYPTGCCGARGWALVDGRRLAVSCTRARGTCDGQHVDEITGASFTVTAKTIAQSREGKTR